jgi:AcrR family transcriptional regulator
MKATPETERAKRPVGGRPRGRPHLRPEEKTLRRRHFLEAACLCFARKGFEATTMDEVARCAGYSPGSLYLYFTDKRELFQAVFEERIAELMSRVEECRREKDPAAAVERLATVVFQHWQEKSEQCRVYMTERAAFEWNIRDEFGRKVFEEYLRFLDLVEAVCRNGVRKGVFTGSPRLLAHFLVGMMNSTVFHWMRGGMKGALTARSAEVAAFFLKGAAAASPSRPARGMTSRFSGAARERRA